MLIRKPIVFESDTSVTPNEDKGCGRFFHVFQSVKPVVVGWVRQKLTSCFPAVSESRQSELDRVLVYANLRRQHALIWVFVSFHLAVFFQEFVRTGNIYSPYIEAGHLAILFSCIILLTKIGKPKSPTEIDGRHRVCEGAVFFLLFLNAGLRTGFVTAGEFSIIPYVASITISGASFFLSSRKSLALFGFSWSVWVAVVWHFSSQSFAMEIVFAGTLGTVMALFIARITYVTFVKDFLSWTITEQHKQHYRELKTLNEISARLAHEIRNPLMSAGGFARRLSASMSVDDPNRIKAEVIVKEVARLEAILSMILNYLKPLELNKSPADLSELVTTALHNMCDEIKKRKTELDLNFDFELPKISVDPTFIEEAIEVLLNDALNRMPDEATLFIATLRENNLFKLVIRYPVLNISADDVKDFFYPFTTSRREHDDGYDGLDLPKSKLLVEKHGGEVNVTLQQSFLVVIQVSLPLMPM